MRLSRAEFDQQFHAVIRKFSGIVGFAAQHLGTGEEIRVNADEVFGTASTFKLAVLVEVFRQARAGRIALDERLAMRTEDIVRGSGVLKELSPGLQPTVKDLAMLMVIVSDNTATNMLIDKVGGVETINRTMQVDYGLRTIVVHTKIDFNVIGDDVRRLAEASPSDLMRLVKLIVQRKAVDATASDAMLNIMRRQQYLDQVPRYFNYNPYAPELKITQSMRVASKTGFYPGTRVDTGAVLLPDGNEIVYCAAAQGSADRSMTIEAEPMVVNGLLGKLMLEYWWPAEEEGTATLPTPYMASFVEPVGTQR